MKLGTERHDRDAAGYTYVYPVVSRRAEGLSVGVNLNPNNACNWRCVYCQVPDLVLGKAPPIDTAKLGDELRSMLRSILEGDYLERHVPAAARRLADVAFSGNGEPTSSPQFAEAVDMVLTVLGELQRLGKTKLVVITNGSLIHRSHVTEGLESLAAAKGEAWFKLDSATADGMESINGTVTGLARVRTNLDLCAGLIPTWVQTCVFSRRGEPPAKQEQAELLEFLAERLRAGAPLRGVLLYGLARPSHQPEASELSRLPAAWLENFAERLRTTGLEVRVFH